MGAGQTHFGTEVSAVPAVSAKWLCCHIQEMTHCRDELVTGQAREIRRRENDVRAQTQTRRGFVT